LEPLVSGQSNEERRSFSTALFLLTSSLVVLPLVFFIADALLSFESSSLTPIFFKLLFRALTFGATQAFLSASLSIGAAFILCLALLSLAPARRALLESPLRALGQLLFVLPGTSIALLVLSLPRGAVEALEGWPLIICAHVLWSSFFVAAHCVERLSDWMESEGGDLLRVAQSLGASRSSALRTTLLPVLKGEIQTWFPLIFLWSFGAFSTVLLLGSGPTHSTPEVLLFYTLLNDVNSSRLLLIFVATLGLQIAFLGLASRSSSNTSRLVSPASREVTVRRHEQLRLPAAFFFRAIAVVLISGALALLVSQVASVIFGGAPPPSLWSGLLQSWLYAACATLFCGALLVAISAVDARTRTRFVWGLALSPVLIGVSWSRMPGLGISELPWATALPLCAFALALLQLPFSALWIERSLSTMNSDLILYARSAGLSESQLFWKLRLPYLRPVFEKVLCYVFCIALGEVALASIWLRERPLLSLEARRLAQSYDFNASAWVFVLTLASALAVREILSRSLRKFLA